MISTELITGRPYGGCAIIYRKTFSKPLTTLNTASNRFCAISLTCSTKTILLICVYLPTNYCTSQSNDLYFNVDYKHPSTTCEYCDTSSQKDSNCLSNRVDWLKIDPISVERYQDDIQSNLPILSDELQNCPGSNCKSHHY